MRLNLQSAMKYLNYRFDQLNKTNKHFKRKKCTYVIYAESNPNTNHLIKTNIIIIFSTDNPFRAV